MSDLHTWVVFVRLDSENRYLVTLTKPPSTESEGLYCLNVTGPNRPTMSTAALSYQEFLRWQVALVDSGDTIAPLSRIDLPPQPTMHSDPARRPTCAKKRGRVTHELADRLWAIIRPMLSYLVRLRERMEKGGFVDGDPLFELAKKAEDAVRDLSMEAQYLSSETGTGRKSRE